MEKSKQVLQLQLWGPPLLVKVKAKRLNEVKSDERKKIAYEQKAEVRSAKEESEKKAFDQLSEQSALGLLPGLAKGTGQGSPKKT